MLFNHRQHIHACTHAHTHRVSVYYPGLTLASPSSTWRRKEKKKKKKLYSGHKAEVIRGEGNWGWGGGGGASLLVNLDVCQGRGL